MQPIERRRAAAAALIWPHREGDRILFIASQENRRRRLGGFIL